MCNQLFFIPDISILQDSRGEAAVGIKPGTKDGNPTPEKKSGADTSAVAAKADGDNTSSAPASKAPVSAVHNFLGLGRIDICVESYLNCIVDVLLIGLKALGVDSSI